MLASTLLDWRLSIHSTSVPTYHLGSRLLAPIQRTNVIAIAHIATIGSPSIIISFLQTLERPQMRLVWGILLRRELNIMKMADSTLMGWQGWLLSDPNRNKSGMTWIEKDDGRRETEKEKIFGVLGKIDFQAVGDCIASKLQTVKYLLWERAHTDSLRDLCRAPLSLRRLLHH